MGILEILGLAGSISLLSGWRMYLCLVATGLAMHFQVLPLPEHLESLRILANPWVLGTAGFAALCEFFADKIAWIDSIWDTIHTVIRPLGGALLTLAIVDPSDPAMQVIAFILGGGGTLLAHGGKAGARAMINASPEPFSNIAVSTVEDVTSAGLLYLCMQYPLAAGAVALVLLAIAIALLMLAARVLSRLIGPKARGPAD